MSTRCRREAIPPLPFLEFFADGLQLRAVRLRGHSEEETEGVTDMQRDAALPILKRELTGREKTVLDSGCGPGAVCT